MKKNKNKKKKTTKLWGGRFSKETDALTDQFNASINFDKRLFKEDIHGSIAHAAMLGRQGIITEEESEKIIDGLEAILNDINTGKIELSEEFEDIHMNIEHLLTTRIGEAGKKLHTGRSRNDQVATDLMLYIRNASEDILKELHSLLDTIIEIAKEHTETIMPGYTHLQRAQPITFAHYLLAYFQMFRRDYIRFTKVKTDSSYDLPLGSGALAGTTYPIDRFYTAKLLDFKIPKENSIDGVSDRDYAIDFLEACAVCMMHLSRICEEIIIYNSSEFNFITLDDAFTTGSSIMPQKKNPDIAELIRGKTGRTYGNLMSLLTTMKGLPLAYNKDMQEDKEPIFDSFDTVHNSLKIFTKMLKTIIVHKDIMREAASGGFTNATDLADWLVEHGIAFRDAHEIVGNLVLYCEMQNKSLNELTLEELKDVNEIFDESVYKAISLEEMINKRDIEGAPAPQKVNEELENVSLWIDSITD